MVTCKELGWKLDKDDVHLFDYTIYFKPLVEQGTNKYIRIIHGVEVDVYDVLKAWDVTCPATQHAIKKLLMPGQRGSKDKLHDLNEAEQSIKRAIELNRQTL